jgi:hypothetical protein
MSIAARRLAQGILASLGLTGCYIGSPCADPPGDPPEPVEVEIAPGCTTPVSAGEETAVVCIPYDPESEEPCPDTDGLGVEAEVERVLEQSEYDVIVTRVACFTEQQSDTAGDRCCYGAVYEHYQSCGAGRPFVAGGAAHVAPLLPHSDWCRVERAPGAVELGPLAREALAAQWAEDALFEHASVASFARFVLELLAVGAPPGLVRDAQRALADEIAHAELCFALASRYAGRPLGPGALQIPDQALERRDLASIAAATVREGIFGETISALIAQAAAEQAEDPDVRRALRRIAADESRHAGLAFRFVAWALERGGAEVRAAVEAAFEEPPSLPASSWPAELEAVLRAHGRLGPGDRRAAVTAALESVIYPCARAMLHGRPVAAGGAVSASVA